MIVDLDIGNTRLKWIVHGEGETVSRGGESHDRALEALRSLTVPVERVRVASVEGSWDDSVRRLAMEYWHVRPEFACASASVAGLKCGYRNPASLGVDRWLAMLAARVDCRQPLLVVSAGTAMTLDLVDADGDHRGGYILPGLGTMGASLGLRTWGIRIEQPSRPSLTPARDTGAAVANGSLAAMVGALRVVREQLPASHLVLTGGDAPLLAEWIPRDWPRRVEPDLVLRGLAVALP